MKELNTGHSETDLLKGLANKDKVAVETIYETSFNMVQSLIINNNGNEEDARDIFQEAMIVLFEKAKSENFELSCQVKTYLYSVCRRLWLKRLHQSGRYITFSDRPEEYINADEDINDHEQSEMQFHVLETAINNLGEPCKSLIEGFYMQKMSMQEIAAAFGYTNADNAKTQKYKCLMRLKKLFFSTYKLHSGDE